MPVVTINNKEVEVPQGSTIIQACEIADVEIPRFCYHERLAIAGNCRMCLVEVEGGPPKPVASCAMPANDGMKIHTDTPMVKKAREGVMEFLLANHPLDCPICDQGGECDLQDQAYQYGVGKSDYHEHKRAVKDKNMGPLIKTHMTRCIHCTRCIRFIEDVAGTCELGAVNRGEAMEITPYLEKSISSELSGNVIDLCPVGALTSKPYAFKARSWELRKTESIDVMDAVGSNIRIDSKGIEVLRILPRLNEEINEEWISDKTRFCYEGLKYQRLDKAYVKKDGKLRAASFNEAYDAVADKLKNTDKNQIAALSGSLSSFDDVVALKKLLETLEVNNVECRIGGQKIDSGDKCSYLFNSSIAGIDEIDQLLLVGINPRKDAPILNARIRKRFLTKELEISAIGVDADLTYDYNHLGDDVSLLIDLLDGKLDLAQKFKLAKKPAIIFGEDVVKEDNGLAILNLLKEIAQKYNLIQDNFNGFNFLAKSTGLINGLEAGFTSELGIDSLLDKCEKNEIKVVILHNVDDEIDFAKLENSFVIYIGSHGDKGAHAADIIIPAPAYSEKDAIYVNLEGRAQKTKKAVAAPGEAKDDVDIIVDLANKLGYDLGSNNRADLQKELSTTPSPKWNDVKNGSGNVSKDQKIQIKDYDFYLTNQITRASKTLNKCSGEFS
ncbi:MAG: NADH-quinone oxidoreductase subunit G [Rickettsiales bacterium]|nr:NADH-quinone oxidoreductase subunit G [Rickettsiales bacterium]